MTTSDADGLFDDDVAGGLFDDLLPTDKPVASSPELEQKAAEPTPVVAPVLAQDAEPEVVPPVRRGSAKGPEPLAAADAEDSYVVAPKRVAGYTVVARRYRPQTFGELVGQSHISEGISQSILSGRIAHAYLFSGPRGTGKTSSARILAKSLNCMKDGPRPDPCGVCASCVAISAGSSLDVIEIDAASNTGVDNIRDLRTGVALSPFSRYKVYIVDEVHMLSNQAFNALLKTLEEPPPQVVFVLATTEIHKVPETIVSRCQAFQFRRFSVREISDHLLTIIDREVESRGIEIEAPLRAEIADLLARHADGGMRDAQVALDQVLVLAHGRLTLQTLQRFLGLTSQEVLDRLLIGLHERATSDLLNLVEELVTEGQDLERFVKSAVEFVRDLLIVRHAPENRKLVEASDDRFASLVALSSRFPAAFLTHVAGTLMRLVEDLRLSSQPRYLLELVLIRLTVVDAFGDVSRLMERLDQLEHSVSTSSPAAESNETRANTTTARAYAQETPEPAERVSDTAERAEPMSAVLGPDATAPQLLAVLQKASSSVNRYLHVSLLEVEEARFNDETLELHVPAGNSFVTQQFAKDANIETLQNLTEQALGRKLLVRIVTPDATPSVVRESVVPDSAAPTPDPETQSVEETAALSAVTETTHDELRDDDGEEPATEYESAESPTDYELRSAMPDYTQVITGSSMLGILAKNEELRQVCENIKRLFGVSMDDFSLHVKQS